MSSPSQDGRIEPLLAIKAFLPPPGFGAQEKGNTP